MRGALVAALGLSLMANGARAQAADGLHGRLELQTAALFARQDSVSEAVGGQAAGDVSGDLRLAWEPSAGPWSFSLHYLVSFEDGPNVRLAHEESGLVPQPPATLLNLSGPIAEHGQLIATQGIDRLAVTYSTPSFVFRLGRQALTWGAGLVFRPTDLFDPFSPTATDTEYKPGTDMAYAQWLLPHGSDLQAVIAPRAQHLGEPPSANSSSFALHLRTSLFGHQTTWLVARDHGDVVTAVGVNGAISGATWNLELVPAVLNRGGTRLSAVANVSDAVTLLGRNATIFAEYFHNGFGVLAADASLASLPRPLTDRLGRGQLFTLRRDYLAAGATIELTPLVNLSPSLIVDANDGSLFALAAVTWSLADNVSLITGAEVPAGPARTEYGGLRLTPANGLRLSPPAEAYVQLRRYF